MTDVYLNNVYVGEVEDGEEFVEGVRNKRRDSDISEETNVFYNEKTDNVQMYNDRGRARRPLIIVEDGEPLLTEEHLEDLEEGELTWSDLEEEGIVEYLDASEEENALVAWEEDQLTEKHTHLEVVPFAMASLTTSMVPYAHYNQSARLNTGSKTQKQSLGVYASNFLQRTDMNVNLLYEPQVPLVQTYMHDIADYEEGPAGQNIVVAMMSYEGFNMEDGVILNGGSVDRGLARSAYFRTMSAEELKHSGGLVDEITVPDKDVKGYKSEEDYKYLEEDGIIHPETEVEEGDVVIGKTSPPRFLSSLEEYNLTAGTRRESSVSVEHGEEGKIDLITITETEEGNKFVQVKVRDQRVPEMGDKFASRHGQKGVVGKIVNQTDIPFSSNGIVPDMIISPHGIPSRMTVGHLIEILGGKVGALSGRFIDGTLFDEESKESLREELSELGFREDGTETFYNPRTGEKMEARIFVGNMYYLKLKHMVANKIHARSRGPIQLLTRQPTEGRSKEGGLRLGEMEKDVFVAHGSSLVLKERFGSDKTNVPVCEECGLVAVNDHYEDKLYCSLCGDDTEIDYVEMSYAFKLLLDELKGLTVYPGLDLKEKFE